MDNGSWEKSNKMYSWTPYGPFCLLSCIELCRKIDTGKLYDVSDANVTWPELDGGPEDGFEVGSMDEDPGLKNEPLSIFLRL